MSRRRTLVDDYFDEPVFWRGEWHPRSAVYADVSHDCANSSLNFILDEVDKASERERRRVLFSDCASALEERFGTPDVSQREADVHWVPRGEVFQIFDGERISRGAWNNEAAARRAFGELPSGEFLRCMEFVGLFPHADFVKREVLSSEVRA